MLKDRIFKGFAFDVIVHSNQRLSGLGSLLMSLLIEEPQRRVESKNILRYEAFLQNESALLKIGPLPLRWRWCR